ncbi:uncharacterized protein LOC107305228 [Oryza brachyantha]|uniref:uncharacterized protein LOC107305228 n=1 Tax=Oryza brachyantha TaxID=4533 RepID=UPI000776A794|nr:uncharacterized protein LOC107305228 [Oryza brachyantha]
MQERFGLRPREETTMYRRPYPEWFERVVLPHRYKVPNFSKFSGQDGTSTIKHVSRFLAQCGEASAEDALKVRSFPLSLSGSAFPWFSSLPPNLVKSWADLEKQFHKYFFAGVQEMTLTDLTTVKQKIDESVHDYVQRFRNVRSRFYRLNFSDQPLAELAFQGLLGQIREKFSAQEFESLAHLAQKVSAHEIRYQEARKEKFQCRVTYLAKESSDSDIEESDIGLAQWTRNKKPVNCPWVKGAKETEKFDFDVNKADMIFDLLLQEKPIQLPAGHVIPSAKELKKKKFCKWHNSVSHHTNDCQIFRRQIQMAVKQGRFKFEETKKPMKIDGHPFPVNMVQPDISYGPSSSLRKRPGTNNITSTSMMNRYHRCFEMSQRHDGPSRYDDH